MQCVIAMGFLYRVLTRFCLPFVNGMKLVNQLIKELPFSEKEKILFTHDESTFNANDGKRWIWIQGDAHPLGEKSKDRGIMVSEFMTPRGQ